MKFAYYPGCSGHGTAKEYEASTRAVCWALGLELTEIEDWSCCGSTPAHALDITLSGALSVRNLALAGQLEAKAVVTPCPSCLSNLKLAKSRMNDPDFKAKVDSLLGPDAPKETALLPETRSVLQVILEEVGPEAIALRVTKPLEGVKLAAYYGCLMSRPSAVMQFDDPENPMAMDLILTALGAEMVPFPMKTECCGAAMGIPRKDVVTGLSARIVETAQACGAQAIVAACPLCHMNLDLRQRQAANAAGKNLHLPVFYYTQLMGLAFGLLPENLLLDKLAVSPEPLLKEIAARGAARRQAAQAARKARAAQDAATQAEGAAS